MIVSLNWLKKYVDINVDESKLMRLIGARLVEIEEVKHLADKYRSGIIVKVVECVEHPDSDHLHVCRIDDGGACNDAKRDDDGLVQVVCGAPNVRTGFMAAWLPPNSIVPETYDTNDEFKLGSRKLRGVMSQGMLASPRELDLWNEHEGIMEIDGDIKPGTLLRDYLELDDTLIEVENKSLTHRPDCFGVIGVAREVAAILGQTAKIPDWFNNLDGKVQVDSETVKPSVKILDDDLCARYECVALDNVSGDSNLTLVERSYLARIGCGSISAPVDITNQLMFDSGQPLHAFDLDKVIELSPTGQPSIIVRTAKDGEELELLDGRTIKMTSADIVVAVGSETDSVAIALAGAMGGMATEITKDTKRVLLESASFDLFHLRTTQFRHGIFSEAITRFTKGQPAPLTRPVLVEAVNRLCVRTGARVISGIASDYPSSPNRVELTIPIDEFTNVLGQYNNHGQAVSYSDEQIVGILNNLQYSEAKVINGELKLTTPWWRTDLHIAEDIIEDVGRVSGYDDIIPNLPTRQYVAAEYSPLYLIQQRLRDRLIRAGGNEVTSYSFIHGKLLDAVHDDKSKAYRIVNAISPDLQYYRRSILPSLVERVRDNLRAGYDNFMLFEIGKVHKKGMIDDAEPTLPAEFPEVAGLLVNKSNAGGAAYYQIKKIVEYAMGCVDGKLAYTRLDKCETLDSEFGIYEPSRSAMITINNEVVGVLGELRLDVRNTFKLPEHTAGFSLMVLDLAKHLESGSHYTPVLRYQGTSRDITYRAADSVTYQEVFDFTNSVLTQSSTNNLVYVIEPKDIYNTGDGYRNITLHIDFADRTQTINTKLVGKIMDTLARQSTDKLGAEVI